MGTAEVGRFALMSIHPVYVDMILSGQKQVEFRKRPLRPDITHVLIYATRPVSMVVGGFIVEGQTTASVDALWSGFAEKAGIGLVQFETYFAEYSQGTVIEIASVFRFPSSLRIDCLGRNRPPQSFEYLKAEEVTEVSEWITSGAGCGKPVVEQGRLA